MTDMHTASSADERAIALIKNEHRAFPRMLGVMQLLPLARTHLTVDDGQSVASAFGDNTDPLFGDELTAGYRNLYRCIAELTPAPLKSYLEGAAPAGSA
jgi:hypothetical protein